jgi:hypothetical protein
MRPRGRAAALHAERDVLRNAHRLEEREVLEHHGDAGAPRGVGASRREGRPVEGHRALVGADQAVDDLDQRRLARAVLAEERVDLAGRHVEGDVGIGLHARIGLRDAADVEERRHADVPRVRRSPHPAAAGAVRGVCDGRAPAPDAATGGSMPPAAAPPGGVWKRAGTAGTMRPIGGGGSPASGHGTPGLRKGGGARGLPSGREGGKPVGAAGSGAPRRRGSSGGGCRLIACRAWTSRDSSTSACIRPIRS